jgi:biopolymer transport protein ExbB
MKNFKIILAVISFIALPAYSQQSATTIDALLERVEQGRVNDNLENQKREAEFRQKRDQQETLLADAVQNKVNEEIRSAQLEALFEKNETVNNDLQETLGAPLGALKELFGVMQQVAGDARTRFDNSLTNIQYPNRASFLEGLAKKIGSNSKLPSIEEIEKLWGMLHREMTEAGKVVKFTTDVIDTNGSKAPIEVARVGLFNIVADGKYLNYSPETGNVTEIPRQPEGRGVRRNIYTRSTSELFNPSNEKVAFGIDPTLGQVLTSIDGEETDCDLLCQFTKK